MRNLHSMLTAVTELFPQQYQTFDEVNSYLNHLKYHHAILNWKVLDYEMSVRKKKMMYEKKEEKLDKVKANIRFLEHMIANIPDSSYTEKYKWELYDDKIKERNLELWIKQYKPEEKTVEYFEYLTNKERLRYVTEVGTELCEWFATGAVGPGTLEFLHETYTVE